MSLHDLAVKIEEEFGDVIGWEPAVFAIISFIESLDQTMKLTKTHET